VSRGAFARAVVAIALGALVVRVAYVLALGHHPALGADGTWYALQSGTIANGAGYVDPQRYYSFRGAVATAQFPPLWPGLLAVVHELGIDTARGYRIFGGVVGSVTVVLTGYLGRTLAGARVGIVAAVVVAVSPFLIAADGSLMAEGLFLALVTAAVLAAVQARRRGGFGWFALVGLLLGLAALARSDGLVVLIVLVPVVAWCAPGAWLRRVALAATAVAVVAVVLAPWAIRNTDAMGTTTVLSNNSGTLFSGANCEATYSGRQLAGWDYACIPQPRGVSESKRASEQRRAGIDYARDHWERALVVAPLRAIRGWGLWSPSALLDSEVVESRTRSMQTVGWVASLALLALAAGGVVVMRRARRELVELLAMVGAATLILVTSWGNQRFRLVAEPELAVLAAAALVHLWTRARSRHVERVSEQVSVPRTVVEPGG
jgi:hypothetical protein